MSVQGWTLCRPIDVRCWMLKVGCSRLEVGCSMLGGGCWRLDVRCWMVDVRRFVGAWICGRPGFVDLIQPIRLHCLVHAPLPAAPLHFNAHGIGGISGRKYPQGVITRQIPPPADHLLALRRDRPLVEPNLRPNSALARRET